MSAWLLAAFEDSLRSGGDKQAAIALARRLSAVIYAHALGRTVEPNYHCSRQFLHNSESRHSPCTIWETFTSVRLTCNTYLAHSVESDDCMASTRHWQLSFNSIDPPDDGPTCLPTRTFRFFSFSKFFFVSLHSQSFSLCHSMRFGAATNNDSLNKKIDNKTN